MKKYQSKSAAMNKTITVFNGLLNIYGASFARANGQLHGETFKEWAKIVEGLETNAIVSKLEAIRAKHLIEVGKCKYIKPVTLIDFQNA
jgi:negative regulator of replication initiation